MNFCSSMAALIAFPACFLGSPVIAPERWNIAGRARPQVGQEVDARVRLPWGWVLGRG